MDKIRIWTDHYEKDDKAITFVNGYALVDINHSAVCRLAKVAGQTFLQINTHPKEGLPTTSYIEL